MAGRPPRQPQAEVNRVRLVHNRPTQGQANGDGDAGSDDT